MIPRHLAFVMGAAAIGLFVGCERSQAPPDASSEAAPSAAGAREDECSARVSERLGVAFLRVCPRAIPGTTSRGSAFWISLTPMACSAGTHDAVRCPPVLSLAQPRTDDPPDVPAASTVLAVVVEADIAHKICTMRFAGRLPTVEERSLARESLGIATALAIDSPSAGAIRLQEVAEWVTRRPCDQPTMLEADCAPREFPWTASAAIPWSVVTRCRASPLASTDGREEIGVDGECAGGLPGCAVVGPAADRRGRRHAGVSLACGEPVAAPASAPVDRIDVAAFRCVIDHWM
jgi:hypothetical protein